MQLNTDSKLLEFIRKNKQKVYDFFYVLLLAEDEIEELMVATFRELGNRKSLNFSEHELFMIAWESAAPFLRKEGPNVSFGRDMRSLSAFDENLLVGTLVGLEKQALLLKRLSFVDPDFRVPVILKDVLKFEDEEILKILNLRWSVYRHRLHRGRLETKDALKGKSAPVFSLLKPQGAPT